MTVFAVGPVAAGAAFQPVGLLPARFRLSEIKAAGAFLPVDMAGSYSSDLGSVALTRLDRLQARLSMVTDKGEPTPQFQLFYQRNVETTEAAIRALATGQISLAGLVQGLLETQKAVAQAQAQVAEAQATVASQTTLQRVRDSYSDDNVLSANNAGGGVTITIAAHLRHYLDPVSAVSVSAGTITGQAAATTYYVYYVDEALAGGAVTYVATQEEARATASLDAPYRHKIGAIVTPTNAGAGTTAPSGPPAWKLQRVAE